MGGRKQTAALSSKQKYQLIKWLDSLPRPVTGTILGLSESASKCLGFEVSASSIRTQADAMELEIRRSRGGDKSEANRNDRATRLAVCLVEMADRLRKLDRDLVPEWVVEELLSVRRRAATTLGEDD